ncbi:MCE family protein [Rhodococcus erythropolis]|uniref:MCE family protein n=1 Tax=Rhodococcus erythropolis TaxID=1833 RepID=UPI001E5BCDC8|nr:MULTISPECIES: MCE family protein [Rhodococcus erythropolis group]MCD2107130.1 MCE family protein [Rhodococcus qingshengii]MCZ4526559.1 MCE family protein [Rhodococcus erythropolis]
MDASDPAGTRQPAKTKKPATRKTPMKERSRVHVGLVGTAIILAFLVVIFNYRSIPGVSDAVAYKAEFADASGLVVGDDVQIAGMVVGRVKNIDLQDDHVLVRFDADSNGIDVGSESGAAIRVGTVLGKRFVDLTPAGAGTLPKGSTIPLSRTSSGYDITQSLAEVTTAVTKTDKQQLDDALLVTSEVLADLSPDLAESLTALTRVSATVSSRDQALRDLLAHTGGITEVLADRNNQFTMLLTDGQSLFHALNERSETIHRVIVSTKNVFDQLSAIAQDNETSLPDTLEQVGATLELLNKNYDNINASIRGLRTFSIQLNDVLGSGPFFNSLLANITPVNLDGQQPSSPGAPR